MTTVPEPDLEQVVVTSASLAGLRAAQTLREEGFTGQLVIVGAEPYLPYDRSPLSKGVLSGQEHLADIALDLEGLDADWQLGRSADRLDPGRREVVLDDGQVLRYDGLVVATGGYPRTLPGTDRLDGVYTLRTIDDALQIAAELDHHPRVVISGGGWIGSEVAAECRSRRLDVTIIETEHPLMRNRLPDDVGMTLHQLHADHGVRHRLGQVEQFEGAGRLEQVRLADGSTIAADLAIVGIGVIPTAQDWLHDSGLDIASGLRCDSTCAATGARNIVAAGDILRWDHPVFGDVRVEHWTNAAESGAAAARTLLAGPGHAEPYAPPLYFWSSQYGMEITSIGLPAHGQQSQLIAGSVPDRRFMMASITDDRLMGVAAVNMPHELLAWYDRLGLPLGASSGRGVSRAA